jgi:hypothetical protein
VVCFGVSPEWGAWGVYSFDREDAFPFLHEGVMGILNGGNGVL